jgi:hypothetical protein
MIRDVPAWLFYAVAALQLATSITIGLRCDILSRRIDIVQQLIKAKIEDWS